MKTQLTHAGGALAALAVGVGLALTPTTAQAAPTSQVEAATSWLAGQLPDDAIVKQNFGGTDYPDYGLTIDYGLAFSGSATQSGALDDVVTALADTPETFSEYTSNVGFGDRDDSQIAGATAKLATLVQQVGRDATSFGGHDLVAETETVVVDDGAAAGRASDISNYGDNSNSLGQSFAVRALSTADSDEAAAATDYLIKQQCDTGVFRINMSDAACGAVGGGDVVSVDTTAFAIQALVVARGAGYTGADDAIAAAATYLLGAQEDDGSFLDTGAYNSNSTGLAAAALAAVGEDAAATQAADFVAGLQLPAGAGDDAGAVAYDQAGFDAAEDAGVPENLDDQFRRTTAQAALGLLQATDEAVDPDPGTDPDPEVGPVDSIALQLSDSAPTQGDTITITAMGQDADGRSTGDVSDDLTLESSVESDTVDGNTVTFNHASPHTITATYVDPDDETNTATASITVEVAPLAADTDTDDSGVGVEADSDGLLPGTGTTVQAWQLVLAGTMLLAGITLVAVRRRDVVARRSADR
jgi:hypothetical protein